MQDPAALRERGETIARAARDDPDGLAAFFAPDLSATDREQEAAMDPATATRVLENLRQAFRQGADAYVEAERIPGAELTVLTGAGHGLTDEVWPEVYRWLLSFAPSPGPTTADPSASPR